MDVYRSTGDLWGITHPLCDLSWATWNQGDLSQARALMNEYLATFRKTHSMGGTAMALGYLANMASRMGDFEAALRAAEEGMHIRQMTSFHGRQIQVIADMAHVYFQMGKLPESRQLIEKALGGSPDMGDSELIPTWLLLGKIACHEGRLAEGKALFQKSLDRVTAWDEWAQAEILFHAGWAACLSGDLAEAAQLYRQSLSLKRPELPDLPSRLEKFAYLEIRAGRTARAARLLGGAEALRQQMGLPIFPVERQEYTAAIAQLSALMRPSQQDELWQEGAAMGTEEMIECALAE